VTVQEYMTALGQCAAEVESTPWTMPDAMGACVSWLKGAHVVHLMGNGGSAAIVSHAQNDLVKVGKVRALVHQDIPLLTAYANDHGYDQALLRPLGVWLQPDDVVIAVSSSGMSPNLVQASKAALRIGARLITLSGFLPKNHLRQLGHVNFYVPSEKYGYVELTHAALLHYLTDQLAHA